MRFCEECKETKPFTTVDVQPVCDECTKYWIDVHSKENKKTDNHKDFILALQGYSCKLCDGHIDTVQKAVFHEDESIRYAALCSPCYGRFRLFGFDLALMSGFINGIGYFLAHKEVMTDKDRKWLSVCVNSGPLFSTCCKGQYFSVVVDKHGKLLAEGWNGVPSGEIHCSQGGCDRPVDLTVSNGSYVNCLAQHAEINAIQNIAKEHLKGSTLYVNSTPCHECTRAIIHSGIRRVVFIPQYKYEYEGVIEKLGLNGISAVYLQDKTVLMKQKEDMIRSMRRTYKTNANLVEDIDFAKKMVAYLRFNKMMSRVTNASK